jgi:hypothetical protein
MAALGFWLLDVSAGKASSRMTLAWWWDDTRRSPEGSCLVACGAWFVTMMGLFVPTVFVFAALQKAGIELVWWGLLPTGLLGAAIAGAGVNGARHLLNDNASPTLGSDLGIAALTLAFVAASVVVQLAR